jgi:TRAP-type C4-dicarboxylate transport system permease small subunit
MMNRWERLDEIIGQVEQILLVLLLSWMILIAFSQIVLRNTFSTGLTWGDPLVRSLVLWIGFIGAAIATKEGKHIRIDLASRWTRPMGKRIAEVITHAFSFLICCSMTLAAIKFIKNEIQMKNVLFLGIPSWISEMILPIAFGLMAFRFGLYFLRSLSLTLKIGMAREQEGKR